MTAKPGAKAKANGLKRRDATGHLDPRYARDLRALSGASQEGDNHAFLARAFAKDELSEELGEAFVESATSGEEAEPERHERVSEADMGGPFVTTTARQQFAQEPDESNPEDATREPFPRPHGG